MHKCSFLLLIKLLYFAVLDKCSEAQCGNEVRQYERYYGTGG